jgi:hypothetical protein
VWETLAQVTADLLRAPPLPEQLPDDLAQLAIRLDAAPMVTRLARGRAQVSLNGR